MTLKGYPDQKKVGALQFATVSPVREQQLALDVLAHLYHQLIAADAAEASSTTRAINATAHSALVGDLISFTSGNLDTKEYRVQSVAANVITTAEEMSEAPANADTFDILRPKAPRVSDTGAPLEGSAGATLLNHIHDYAAIDPSTNEDSFGNITSGAWVELIASTSQAVTKINVIDTGGEALEFGVGAAASEVRKVAIPPGGFEGNIDISIPAGSRISLRAVGDTSEVGRFILNAW